MSRLQASRHVAARVLAPSAEALDTPLGPPRSLAVPGVCYSTLRHLPRRDLHPLETNSVKPMLTHPLRHDARSWIILKMWSACPHVSSMSSATDILYEHRDCLQRASLHATGVRPSSKPASRRRLNTSFVERLNLTIRQGSAYWRRRSPCHASGADQLRSHVQLMRCHYNFVRPHRALRFGRETRTPAMQAGLVSKRLALSDIFTARRVTLRVFVAVVETGAPDLPTLSWSYERRTAA